MRCPSCDSEVPGRDLVCGDCGAFVYRNVPPAPREPETGSDPDVSSFQTDATARFQAPVVRIPPSPAPPRPGSAGSRYPTGSGGPDYVYPTLQGWPGLGPEEDPPSVPAGLYGQADGGRPLLGGFFGSTPGRVPSPGAPVRIVDEAELQRRGRNMGRWSIGLAILSLFIPLVGPVGIVTGYFAWRLGETRLGRIGVLASVVAMITGVAIAMLTVPTANS